MNFQRISTVSVSFSKISFQQVQNFEAWIQNVLWNNRLNERNVEVHRTKGRIVVNNPNKVYILQGVRETYELVNIDLDKSDKDDWEGLQYPSKLIFIGKDLSKNDLREAITKAINLEKKDIEKF